MSRMTVEQRELWNLGADAYPLAQQADLHWFVTDRRATRIDGVILEEAVVGAQSAGFSDELKAALGEAIVVDMHAEDGEAVQSAPLPPWRMTRGPRGRTVVSIANAGLKVAFEGRETAMLYIDEHFPLTPLDMPPGQ